jgi:hypothetical protein
MKAYLIATGLLFGGLTAAHVWRVAEEGTGLLRNPWWMLISSAGAVLCLWACRLLWVMHRDEGVHPNR